ncbi:hypothetical protein ACH5RR_003097 [Cinchona calisaya]|uniref:Reverse transcriptase n=1 Tax=Cinchona calisaya TaxID=153742 RepID=A0ABD3AU75_9GENT
MVRSMGILSQLEEVNRETLSPYLFLVCSKSFTSLLNQVVRRNQITGLKVARNGPFISHLFFTGDSLIFCKAIGLEAKSILQVLRKYEATSGQMINTDKSSVLF